MKNRKTNNTQSTRKRDIAALRRRRHRGASLLTQGFSKAQVARLLDVSRQSVGRWEEQLARGGSLALDGARRLGRKPLPIADPAKAARAVPKRDLPAMRRRRLRAIKLLARGKTKAEVARRLGVTSQSVGHWARLHASGGRKALNGALNLGRPPKAGHAVLKRLEKALLKGAPAHGFANELWTLARVREVLWRVCAVRVHRGHVWHLLRALGWSAQRPQTKARERDGKAIRRWIKTTWPGIKKKRAPKNAGSCSWTKAG